MNGRELLQRSQAPEAEHRALPPSKGQISVLGAIVGRATGILPVADAKLLKRRAAGSQAIRRDLINSAVSRQRFLEEFLYRFLIQHLCHEALEYLAFVINGTPEIIGGADVHRRMISGLVLMYWNGERFVI